MLNLTFSLAAEARAATSGARIFSGSAIFV
jgi:hypothetical protein